MPRSPEEQVEYSRNYHIKNRERINAYAREWRSKNKGLLAAQRAERRAWFNSLKDKPCYDCGRSFPPCAMDFDHRDPAEKEFEVGDQIMLNMERMIREIEKCDLVCANCHRIRTHV